MQIFCKLNQCRLIFPWRNSQNVKSLVTNVPLNHVSQTMDNLSHKNKFPDWNWLFYKVYKNGLLWMSKSNQVETGDSLYESTSPLTRVCPAQILAIIILYKLHILLFHIFQKWVFSKPSQKMVSKFY